MVTRAASRCSSLATFLGSVSWVPALALSLVPGVSSALQLRWSSGPTDLTFATASRCTLVVQADSAEAMLPDQWQLLWLADSSGVNGVLYPRSARWQQGQAQGGRTRPKRS